MTTARYSVVFETEESGAISVYVPGLPVYAAADTRRKTETAIQEVLAAYLAEHGTSTQRADIKVARVQLYQRRDPRVTLVGPGALLAARSSRARSTASRANGRLGGRPPGSSRKRAAR